MSDESNSKAQPSNTQSSGMPSKSTPASSSRIGDPARRGYGDRTDEEPERPVDSKGWRFDEETDADAGEGHKGPYASTDSDSDASRPRSADRAGKGSGKDSGVKPASTQGGGGTMP
jgi:hypothetical protein